MKYIVIGSLKFLVKDGRVVVYGFVITPNQIHLIRQAQDKHAKNKVQQNFLKFTAQKMKFRLIDTCNPNGANYKVKTAGRENSRKRIVEVIAAFVVFYLQHLVRLYL